MKRIKHLMGCDYKKSTGIICLNCFKNLTELMQELIDSNSPGYNALNKIAENNYTADTLYKLLNLIEDTMPSTCITEDEATIKDIIE